MTSKPSKYKILALDGGGAKGVYSLGILAELESTLETKLGEFFDLIYGVSTGALIAALLGLGYSVGAIRDLYFSKIPNVLDSRYPKVLIKRNAIARSEQLARLATTVFENNTFVDFQTDIGIVATDVNHRRPIIIKNSVDRAFTRKASFVAGFGLKISEAVEASCSAVPFFRPKILSSEALGTVEVIDGGFSANNPSLFALTDAVGASGVDTKDIALLSLGTGVFPAPEAGPIEDFMKRREVIRLLQLTLDTTSRSMEQLTRFPFPDISYVRINDEFSDRMYAADLLEINPGTLSRLERLGAESFGKYERTVASLW